MEVEAEATDREALLVAWLEEVLFRIEQSGSRVAELGVQDVGADLARGHLALQEDQQPEGTELKAVTYHQLAIRETSQGYEATVYFDV